MIKMPRKQIVLTPAAIKNILGKDVDVLEGHSNKGKKEIVQAQIVLLEQKERKATGKDLFNTRRELDAWRSVQHDL